MDFASNQEAQNRKMLEEIGVKSVEELFTAISSRLRLAKPIHDDGLSEFEGIRLMESLAAKNTFPQYDSYLGAGAYEHHVPALVGAICSKSEFLTSYTPYQAEASQGMLQAIFEFQTAMCALTGLDVSNASLYDGASACAEGLLMTLRCQKERNRVLVAGNVHPHYRDVVKQYICHPEWTLETIPILENGTIDKDKLASSLNASTAGVLLQYPNFFGTVEDLKSLIKIIKASGAMAVVSANPLIYGLYASAAELGADIAVGDCQPLGMPLQFGGPYAGYLTCLQEYLRQVPGRIVGETVDEQGRKGYVLTLQAREQHIRREKATSNICTNQALCALAALVTILWYGKKGFHKLALTNFQRASYLKDKLEEFVPTSFTRLPIFNEFVVKFNEATHAVQQKFRKHGIEPGVALERFYPEMKGCFLVAVTETKSLAQLDKYIEVVKEVMSDE